MTKKDMDNILEALGEATFAGLFKFVKEYKMKKIIEVAHVFDNDKFSPGTDLPTVRITIEPIIDSEVNKKYEDFKKKQLN